MGSSSEARYLLDMSFRLGFLNAQIHERLTDRYTELLKGLQKLTTSLGLLP